ELALTEARIAERNQDFPRVLSSTEGVGRDLARGSFASEWEAHLLRSKAFAGLALPDSALAEGEKALEAVERVRRGFGSGMLRTTYLSDRQEVYSHLVSLLLTQDRISEAFTVSDAARGRALKEGIGAARAELPNGLTRGGPDSSVDTQSGRSATAATLLEAETALLQIDQLVLSIDYLEGFPREERTKDQLTELARLYARVDSLRTRHGELTVRASEIDAAQAALLGTAPTRLEDVQYALLPGQVLVEYLAPPNGSVEGFVLTRSDIHHFRAPISGQNLSSRVRLARELITRGEPTQGEARLVLSGLYEVLLGGVMDTGLVGPGMELLFVPHGALNYLPFTALYDRRAGKYLAEIYLTRVLPSAGALSVLRPWGGEGSRVPENASVLAPFPDRLPGTVAEAEAVARGIPRIQSYLGASATEARLRRELGSHQVVHVATHGVLNPHNPLFSRLEMAPGGRSGYNDGRFEVHELFHMDVASPLVFLSGCETAAGPSGTTSFERGEDLATLAIAFLYAGARNVIATLWPVEDEGAARFAEAFYRGLRNGSPSLALASAQRALLNTEGFREPYHWAAYQLVGGGFVTGPAHKAGAESVQHP
ncbi:MAG: CHAT domain-containing protein, partial [Gemmatimonadota bacterium]